MSQLFSRLTSQTGTGNPSQSSINVSATRREARTSQSLSSFVLSSLDELAGQGWMRRIWPRRQDADLFFPNPNSFPREGLDCLSSRFAHVKHYLSTLQSLHNISYQTLF